MSRWDYGDQTLTTLARNTSGSSDELGSLINQLIQAAEPLAGKFNGAGKAAFDSFKARSEQITADLNAGLGSINEGQRGMESAFSTGNQTMADEAQRNMSAANFDAAKFRTA
ncbi:hypothetical protein SAMN02745673_02466 [Marinactinospora thermotolerans DSM 45154]|uniref:WXG100 family type VII secretion target n=1 Tax=Marinactinospora thermotolerans DSM 45154 TaxID=1122192 RepID=A0A1T4R3E8_9ACTN|nr:hypothetical protein [Marinactinospora thermotolerans]SKA10377.1 hypothetical protein SAMN02745673_02466 [Marinactinospora thermotolerans DSM 45154]